MQQKALHTLLDSAAVIQARGRHEMSAESRKKWNTTVINPHCLRSVLPYCFYLLILPKLCCEKSCTKHKVRKRKCLLTAKQCHHNWALISGGPTSSTSCGRHWNALISNVALIATGSLSHTTTKTHARAQETAASCWNAAAVLHLCNGTADSDEVERYPRTPWGGTSAWLSEKSAESQLEVSSASYL